MNQMTTRKTAIMVDGGYYRKRADHLWGKKDAKERANELFSYCLRSVYKELHADRETGC